MKMHEVMQLTGIVKSQIETKAHPKSVIMIRIFAYALAEFCYCNIDQHEQGFSKERFLIDSGLLKDGRPRADDIEEPVVSDARPVEARGRYKLHVTTSLQDGGFKQSTDVLSFDSKSDALAARAAFYASSGQDAIYYKVVELFPSN